jgi:RimJ/RimL family protein N-acetyltransferase
MNVQFSDVDTTLSDGTEIHARPLRTDDAARLAKLVANLSDESRRRRFMTPVKELSPEELHFLTDVDFVHHIAWIAFRADDRDTAIGVARCVRAEDEPELAESAVTVLDGYQGRGLGTILLSLLAASAQAVGIERFRAYVLESNQAMRELLANLGVPTHFDSPGVLRLEVPVTLEWVDDSPAGRALKGSAKNFLQLAAGRRPGRS